MFRKAFFVLFSCASLFNTACQTVEKVNTNTARSSNIQANLPPGISASPIITITNSSSANADPNAPKGTILQKGATPIPGIPDPATRTPQPKNTPKIPGIPSEEELKRQATTPANRSIMERKPPAMESNSNISPIDRMRKVKKP